MRGIVSIVAAAAQLAVATAAGAATLAYEFRGTGAGTLDGSPFPLQAFRITLLADNTDVAFTGDVWTLPALSARFALDVSGSGSIATQLYTNVNPSSGAIILADSAYAIFFFYDAAFLTWAPVGPIGPIAATSAGSQPIPLATSAGTLVLSSVSDLVFEAPEPKAVGSGAAALAALATRSRLTTSRRGRSRRASSARRA